MLGQGQGDFITPGRLLEADGQIVAKVRSGHGARPARGRGKAEEIPENIAEMGKNVLRAAKAPAAVALHPRMTEAVVAGAFLRITQHVIGFGGLLEALLRLGVAGVAVRMKLHGHFPVGTLDLVLSGGTADVQNFIIVALHHDFRCCCVCTGGRERPC